MADDFRSRLEKEVAALDTPPLGDLVRDSLAQGRRLRTRRRWFQAGAVTVATFAVTGAVLGGQVLAQPSRTSGQTDPVPAAIQPAPSPTTTEARVKATPEGLLAALLEALPAGKTSHYAGNAASGSDLDGTPLTVQTYLDDGTGPGMIRLSVWAEAAEDEVEHGSQRRSPTTQPDGDEVTVMRLPENCVQSLMVSLKHPDGVIVQVTVAGCLAWDGRHNPQGRMALTKEQAIALVDDERLGVLVPQRLADAGARRFPDLPAVE